MIDLKTELYVHPDEQVMNKLHPNDLIDLCLVVEYGGISAAARAVGRPKSSLSLAIRRLEEDLTVRLVDRSKYRFDLTAQGKKFYGQVQPLLMQLDQITTSYRLNSGQIVGSLKIAAPYEFGAHHLAPVIKQIVTENPNLSVTLDVSNSPPKLLFAQGYDVVFVMTNGGLSDSDVVSCRVFMLDRGLFASPEFLRQHGKINEPMDLTKVPLVASTQDLRWRFTDANHVTIDVAMPESNFKSSNAEVRRTAALHGVGVTRVVASFCDSFVKKGRLVRLLPQYQCAPLCVYGVIKERRLMPATVKKLFDELEKSAPDVFIENT